MNDFRFARVTDQTWPKTLLDFWRAAYTVFYVRAPLHGKVATKLRGSAQPVQQPLDKELAAVRALVRSKGKKRQYTGLSQKELLGIMGVLMQFTAVLPRLRPYSLTPYDHVDKLYKEIVKQGSKSPLSFASQLDIALEQTDGDVPEAVWRLFITARQFARWYDTEAIPNMPKLNDIEAMDKMAHWSRALKATKGYGSCPDQDASGDAYYCWTHALAIIVFEALAAKKTLFSRVEARALRNGTQLNHQLAHRVRPQGLPSDHTLAARYGNAIGDCLRAYLNG